MATPRTRWEDHWPDSVQPYIDRFIAFEDEGKDVDGEARFVDVIAPRGARVLDGGCGTGRVAAGIAARGHLAVGIDKDERLLAVALERFEEPTYAACDLLEASPQRFEELGLPTEFDIAVLPGNVLVFCAEDTEADILRAVASVLVDDGRLVVGYRTSDGPDLLALADAVAGDGLTLEHRFATWHLDPWHEDADWVTGVFRVSR